MNDFEERRQERIEHYEEMAEAAGVLADRLGSQARRMADIIPFGQPILIGHHSEKGDRNYRGRIQRTFERSMEAQEKAEYWQRKAAAAASNRTIFSDDPGAVQKLQEKIEKAEKFQGVMVAANKIVRTKGLTEQTKVARLVAECGLKDTTAQKFFVPDFAGRIGIPSYRLTNNNANIRRMKERLATLVKSGADETAEKETNGVRIVDNVEENRLQLFFPGKPDETIRASLKSHGFRWTPTVGAWQRHRSNAATWAAEQVIKAVEEAR